MASDLLLFALRRATNTVSQDFQETLGRDDISPTAYAVLSLLREQPGLRQRGFFTRNPVPGDRRASALVLTEAGTEVATACAEACIRHEHRLQERLGPGGRLQLIELLGRLRAEESAG
jgi:hypothetical protein